MSINSNANADWLGILSTEIKKLDTYIKIDTDQQWSDFLKVIDRKEG